MAALSSKSQSPWSTLPTEFTILGKRWSFDLVDDALDSGNAANCDVRNRTINICNDPQLADDAADSVLHELIHSLCYYGQLELGDKEERTVGVLATTLIAVFSANPKLLDWFYTQLKS